MRNVRALMILLALLAVSSLSVAADPTTGKAVAQPRSTADVVTVKVLPAKLAAKAGAEVSFQIDLAIADTWHLYDHRYAEDAESFFIGVDLMPGEEADLAGFRASFPAGKEGEFIGEKVYMLHHQAAIDVTVTLPADAQGEVTVPFVLSAQACDNSICLQPSDIPVLVHVAVE
ncbi:MAG: protein-disulfide reductase DsbD family protein [Candidatus Krumholzibacteriia bacterium]